MRTFISRTRSITAWALAAACAATLCGVVLLPIGCGGKPASSEKFGQEVSLSPTLDHFSLAMNFFRRFDEFDPEQARRQVLDNLNSWAEEQPPDPNWQPDPLLARLPSPWRELPEVRNLSKLEFGPEDAELLQEAAWARDVSRWVVEQPLEPWLASRLPRPADGLDKADINRLAVALRLFDWTIRNVQLEALLPAPKADTTGPAAGAKEPQTAAKPPPFQGTPGPGYRQHPWQTMLMGRGDAWQRARVFILLCRQEGLDAVMLGLVEGAPTSPPKPWIPALLIRDQLYLFDTALGLPLPGPDGKGIATLARAVAEPQVLRQLDLDEEHSYDVKAESLGQVVALIDATPGYLARRMQLAEARLAGDERMVLSVAPTKLKEKLARLQGVSSVQLWVLPYETLAYRAAYLQLITVSREAYDDFWREEGPFQLQPGIPNTLLRARYQHFRGIFDARDQRDRESQDGVNSQDSGHEKPGALPFYLAARMPDEEIARLEGSEALQRRIWPKFEGEPPDSYAGRRKAMLSVIRPTRQDAAYWIGLTHYERRNYSVALDWLQHRTLEANPDGLWSGGASYNLARCHEALGDLSAARQIYYGDQSPQRHGNQIRAELLDEPAK